MNRNVLKKSLVMEIILLIISSLISSMGIGDNIRIKNEPQGSIIDFYPSIEWSRTYGGWDLDSGQSARQTKDGGYILIGYTRSLGPDLAEAGCLIKTDVIGDIEWYNTYGEPGALNIDVAYSVEQTDDSGYIFTGNTLSYGAIGSDIWLVKTDSNGNEVWNKIYGGKGRDHGYQVLQVDDGGYVVVGYTDSYGAGGLDFCLLKTNSEGIEEWHRTFGGVGKDFARSVDMTYDGGYILTGDTESYGCSDQCLWLVKTDSNGIEEWNRTYGGFGAYAIGESVRQTRDGGYIVTGVKRIIGEGYSVWLIKTDGNGNEVWNKTFGEPSDDLTGNEVQQTTDGGYIIVGYGFPVGPDYSFLIKTDSNGTKEWEIIFEEYDLYDDVYLYSVQQTTDGGYILGGSKDTQTYPNEMLDFCLVKVGHVPDIKITKPENAIYLFNKKIVSFFWPLIIGPIDVEVDTSDDEYGIEKVEFYVDDVYQANDTSEPYSWKWNKLMFFKHTLKAVVFNSNGNVGVEEIVVSKFF